jgi:dienelactone hydrolase
MDTRRDFLQGLVAGLTAVHVTRPAVAAEPDSVAVPARGDAAAGDVVPPTGSDVGSLFPFIRSQAVQGEFPLSFLQDQFRDLPAWKKEARGKLLDLLHYAPLPCDPRAEVVERADMGEYVRETVHFQTTPDLRVPASVLIPKGLTKPAPAVVVLHDHGGMYLWGREKVVETADEHPVLAEFKREAYAGKSIASELVRRGYVVITIDMFYWGERRMLLDGDPADFRERPRGMAAERVAAFNRRSGQAEPLVGRTIYAAGFTWAGVMFWDDLRTVDYLVTRPEVDAQRIGCVGLSVGGLRSCHLAALDDRIKAAVVVGWMASYPAQLRDHVNHTIGFTKLVPGLTRHLDYPDVAALAMPASLLVINGTRDGLFDLDGVKHCFAKLSSCYAKAGVPERFRGRLYDAPHEFNAAMQREAWDWLARWL